MAKRKTKSEKFVVLSRYDEGGARNRTWSVCNCGKVHATLAAAKKDAAKHLSNGYTVAVAEIGPTATCTSVTTWSE